MNGIVNFFVGFYIGFFGLFFLLSTILILLPLMFENNIISVLLNDYVI